MQQAPKILLTPGEPAGIGPDVAVKVAQQERNFFLTAVCDPNLLKERAAALQLPLQIVPILPKQDPSVELLRAGTLGVIPVDLKNTAQAGQLDVKNAAYVLDTLETAADLCLRKHYDALVTGPVQKSVINEAGIAFSGHTEFFADRSGTPKVVMMLATDKLRVALATTHLPLKNVPAAITRDSLQQVVRVLIDEMKYRFGIANPKILVAGLNPHAGESGHLGTEEIETIIPVLESFPTHEAELIGPLPADTLFTPQSLANADAVLAMYHDQGLPVLKYKGFGKAVNITLGLPFVRTSVDHGTALEIAGTGAASENSLKEAIAMAYQLSFPNTSPL